MVAFLVLLIAPLSLSAAHNAQPRTAASTSIPILPLEDRLNKQLSKYLDDAAAYLDVGVWVGVRTPELSFGFASGYSDLEANVTALKTDILPVGSITKSFIAPAIMQLVDDGELYLDEPMYPLVDPFLQRVNGTTMLELFQDRRILNVTVGHLLHMSSGIRDYDDDLVFNLTFNNPDLNLSPLDYLHMNDKSLACTPGDCLFYSSINYIIAGLVLAQRNNCSSWEDLDQKDFIPEPLRSEFDRVTFAGNGPCSQYPNMSHTYAWDHTFTNHSGQIAYNYKNMFDTSCLNGWTSGNVALSAQDAASYYYALLGPRKGWEVGCTGSASTLSGQSCTASATFQQGRLVSGTARTKMQMLEPLTYMQDAWAPGLEYGYGVFNLGVGVGLEGYTQFPWNGLFIGHGGSVYGSYMEAGYHPSLESGFAIGMNKDSLPGGAEGVLFCLAWQGILEAIDPDRLLRRHSLTEDPAEKRGIEDKFKWHFVD